jgi:hypothetical protein
VYEPLLPAPLLLQADLPLQHGAHTRLPPTCTSFIRISVFRIRHFRLNTDPDPDLGFDERKNLQLKQKLNFFGSKTTIYLYLGFHKGRPSY